MIDPNNAFQLSRQPGNARNARDYIANLLASADPDMEVMRSENIVTDPQSFGIVCRQRTIDAQYRVRIRVFVEKIK
jgi:hypothetical protein